jgi:hypothetical protein
MANELKRFMLFILDVLRVKAFDMKWQFYLCITVSLCAVYGCGLCAAIVAPSKFVFRLQGR